MPTRKVIPFTTDEAWRAARKRDITSTDIAALFGVSPYRSAFELWHVKAGNIEEATEESSRMRWGKRLQASIADGFAEERDLSLRPMDEYIRMPDVRIASSFDFCEDSAAPRFENGNVIVTDAAFEDVPPIRFLVETKNVDGLAFKSGWLESEFGLEAPAHIELQAQHQMLVAGVPRCYIVALVGGNTLHVLERQADDIIHARILDVVAEFWARTEAPEPDFTVDAKTISRLHSYSTKGNVLQADADVTQLLAEYDEAATARRVAEDAQDAAKARLLMAIGDAEKVVSEVGTLSCGTVKEADISYHREAYRGFRFFPKRSKK